MGNAGLDLRLAVPRLPRPGETLVGAADGRRQPGGKGLNQAVVAARCGVPVRFCAPLGDDPAEAEFLEAQLRQESFAALHLPRLAGATDFSLLMVLPDGENSIVSTSACSLALVAAEAEPLLADLADGDILLLQGNLSLATTAALLAAGRRRGARTMLNPAPVWPGIERLLGDCSLVVANRVEAQALGSALQACPAVVVTLGAEGCEIVERGRRLKRPGIAVPAIDTTGCGDTFCGVLAAALVAGAALESAVDAAQRAAALTATRAGAFAALPRRDELAAILAPGDA